MGTRDTQAHIHNKSNTNSSKYGAMCHSYTPQLNMEIGLHPWLVPKPKIHQQCPLRFVENPNKHYEILSSFRHFQITQTMQIHKPRSQFLSYPFSHRLDLKIAKNITNLPHGYSGDSHRHVAEMADLSPFQLFLVFIFLIIFVKNYYCDPTSINCKEKQTTLVSFIPSADRDSSIRKFLSLPMLYALGQ